MFNMKNNNNNNNNIDFNDIFLISNIILKKLINILKVAFLSILIYSIFIKIKKKWYIYNF